MQGKDTDPSDVLLVVRPVLQSRGFVEFPGTNEPPKSTVTFTDWYLGENPEIWVTVSQTGWPVSVDFTERWTSHRSHKHMSVAKEVKRTLEEHQFRVQADPPSL